MTKVDEEGADLETYVQVTFERLIIAHLEDAVSQLERSKSEKLRLFLAARSIHLALVTALSSALSGTDGTGAMAAKERSAWLQFFEDTRAGFAEAPSTRMASFKELLQRAQEGSTGWLVKPLVVDEAADLALTKLTALRDWTEHPRPDHHFIEPAWMLDAMEVGINVTQQCTELVCHRYDPPEQQRLEKLFQRLREVISAI